MTSLDTLENIIIDLEDILAILEMVQQSYIDGTYEIANTDRILNIPIKKLNEDINILKFLNITKSEL